MNINAIKNAVVSYTGRTGLVLSKYSPEIMIGVGVVGVVASTVMACKATLKIEEINKTVQEDLDKVHKGRETVSEEAYSKEDYEKDLATVHIRHLVWIGKLYLPAVAVGLGSIALILGSHHILNKRNLALMAAYKVVQESYSKYRRRVVDEFGAEKDYSLKHGTKLKELVETNVAEDGKKTKLKKVVHEYEPNEDGEPSMYAKFFDESSVQWQRDATHNLFFLKSQQNYANDLLKSRGHLFLNEVYDMVGLPRTSAGAIVGWVKETKDGDSFVDFGIYNVQNELSRDFVNGYSQGILLDFNVDGVIYNLI